MEKNSITSYFKTLQDSICDQLEIADGQGQFKEDRWERPGGGGGRSRVIQGEHIQKGGVNFSAVHGVLNDKAGKALGIEPGPFYATGVSIVLHPKNPHVPIIHMNVRYFEMNDSVYWFGGGIDLTPHYIIPEQAGSFHRSLKKVCDAHHQDYYPKFKQWADDYFYLRHRKETRGVGGIFFDRLSESEGISKADRFAFVQSVGEAFAPAYIHLLALNKGKEVTDDHLQWQALRRGRYVEFNLVWDRGTKFGLETDGRTESILMSMPPQANWVYDYQAQAGSPEEETLKLLKKQIQWIDY